MESSSEDVILCVSHVKNRKNDGTLYIMNDRLIWVMEEKNDFNIILKYSEIKVQKISPEGKQKVQLQIVLHDGTAVTFHFVNPAGLTQQVKDRDSIKEILQQLLPKFQKKIDKDIEEKNRLLSENPTLLQLYKDLVVLQIITPDEFWNQYAPQFVKKNESSTQEVGVSASFLAGIKPQADCINGLKYNLTVDMMQSIFKTYPVVQKKHLEYVPHKFTEAEFWTRFFQSHYFHKDRIGYSSKDIFADCVKSDEQVFNKLKESEINDPSINLQNFVDSELQEGFGEWNPNCSEHQGPSVVHQNIIKRFNYHSFMILQSLTCKNNLENNDNCSKYNEMKLLEKMDYDDLEPIVVPSKQEFMLKSDRYLQGLTASTSTFKELDNETVKCLKVIIEKMPSFTCDLTQISHLDFSSSLQLMTSLLPPTLKNTISPVSSIDIMSKDVAQELKQLYISLNELLRHFWSCFPVNTIILEEKLTKMKTALDKFVQVRLKLIEDKIKKELLPVESTAHLRQMLEAAYLKYNLWQQRKSQNKFN